MEKSLKIKHKKLGKQGAWGIYHPDTHTIILDPRLKGKKFINIFIHELIHAANHDFSETKVIEQAKFYTDAFWKIGLRMPDNATRQPS